MFRAVGSVTRCGERFGHERDLLEWIENRIRVPGSHSGGVRIHSFEPTVDLDRFIGNGEDPMCDGTHTRTRACASGRNELPHA